MVSYARLQNQFIYKPRMLNLFVMDPSFQPLTPVLYDEFLRLILYVTNMHRGVCNVAVILYTCPVIPV